MHRFFVAPGVLAGESRVQIDELAHQLHTVLRLRPGAQITLLDGSGLEYPAEIVMLDARRAQVAVGAGRRCLAEPRLHLTLYACSLKGEKFEWMLQKATEVGVSRFAPVISQRSVVRPAQALERKYSRWCAVIREAAEQSGRGKAPELAPPLDFESAVRTAAGVRLLLWEGADHAAPQPLPPQLAEAVSLLVGPEGGLDPSEAALALEAGWTAVSLGPRTLRAESASIVAAAVVMAMAGEMGSFQPLPSPFGEGPGVR